MANYTLERDGWCARERVPNVCVKSRRKGFEGEKIKEKE